jgi:hypothetical protein
MLESFLALFSVSIPLFCLGHAFFNHLKHTEIEMLDLLDGVFFHIKQNAIYFTYDKQHGKHVFKVKNMPTILFMTVDADTGFYRLSLMNRHKTAYYLFHPLSKKLMKTGVQIQNGHKTDTNIEFDLVHLSGEIDSPVVEIIFDFFAVNLFPNEPIANNLFSEVKYEYATH